MKLRTSTIFVIRDIIFQFWFVKVALALPPRPKSINLAYLSKLDLSKAFDTDENDNKAEIYNFYFFNFNF